jgi:hypothetical protein
LSGEGSLARADLDRIYQLCHAIEQPADADEYPLVILYDIGFHHRHHAADEQYGGHYPVAYTYGVFVVGNCQRAELLYGSKHNGYGEDVLKCVLTVEDEQHTNDDAAEGTEVGLLHWN